MSYWLVGVVGSASLTRFHADDSDSLLMMILFLSLSLSPSAQQLAHDCSDCECCLNDFDLTYYSQ